MVAYLLVTLVHHTTVRDADYRWQTAIQSVSFSRPTSRRLYKALKRT